MTSAPESPPIKRLENADEVSSALRSRRERLTRSGDNTFPVEDRCGLVFEDEYILVFRDPVRFPGGAMGTYLRIGERAAQGSLAGVVVLPIFDGRIFLHRIYRYPVQSWEWELPRGYLEKGHTPEQMVHRELREESGLKVETLQEIGIVHSNTGLLSGGASVWYASISAERAAPSREEGEVIEDAGFFTPNEVWSMIASGKIMDGFTLSSIALAVAAGILPASGRS